jgi:hypothetical protein
MENLHHKLNRLRINLTTTTEKINSLVSEINKTIDEINGITYDKGISYPNPTNPNFMSIIGARTYFVSKEGIVINSRGNILTPSKDRGYLWVSVLGDNGLRLTKRVHRIVAEVFIPNPENKPLVNHINGVKDDNNVTNLEWATISENSFHTVHILNKRTKVKKFYNGKSINQLMEEEGLTYAGIYAKYFRRKRHGN